ncbi:MAG: thymidine kinase [Patescibacteria group bacterium]|nr:thymidine kinase [Patescibacteria group bacterium]MBU2509227.1 thymidine kinase [Patescibacteria group bacterium]
MKGSITFFTGPMFCGKTLELVRHLQIHAAQRVPTVCIRPMTDTRSRKVESRAGLTYEAISIPDADEQTVTDIIERYDVIGVDEMQFFSKDIVPILHQAARHGKVILTSGLDTDFRGLVFPSALALFSLPETEIHRSRSVCSVCRKHNATRTQRLKNGQPVNRNEPTVAIEGADANYSYEPRCSDHHVVLG